MYPIAPITDFHAKAFFSELLAVKCSNHSVTVIGSERLGFDDGIHRLTYETYRFNLVCRGPVNAGADSVSAGPAEFSRTAAR